MLVESTFNIMTYIFYSIVKRQHLLMRQIKTNYSFVAGRHDVIFKVSMQLMTPVLLNTASAIQLLSTLVPHRLVELTETVFCFDDVEILPVRLCE